MKTILTVKNLNVRVEHRTLIRNLSFYVAPGTLTWITGENGVGKTTLVKTLLRDFKHGSRAVQLYANFNQVQVVPQFRNVASDFPLTIHDFVSLSANQSRLPWLNRAERQQLKTILKLTNLTKIADEPLGEASGGEQQRAYLAQALVANPKLLFLDEATASLDVRARIVFLKVVKRIIHLKNLAVVFITHDPELVSRFGDYELRVQNQRGRIKKLGGRK